MQVVYNQTLFSLVHICRSITVIILPHFRCLCRVAEMASIQWDVCFVWWAHTSLWGQGLYSVKTLDTRFPMRSFVQFQFLASKTPFYKPQNCSGSGFFVLTSPPATNAQNVRTDSSFCQFWNDTWHRLFACPSDLKNKQDYVMVWP